MYIWCLYLFWCSSHLVLCLLPPTASTRADDGGSTIAKFNAAAAAAAVNLAIIPLIVLNLCVLQYGMQPCILQYTSRGNSSRSARKADGR
jgi:hypothetical protein